MPRYIISLEYPIADAASEEDALAQFDEETATMGIHELTNREALCIDLGD